MGILIFLAQNADTHSTEYYLVSAVAALAGVVAFLFFRFDRAAKKCESDRKKLMVELKILWRNFERIKAMLRFEGCGKLNCPQREKVNVENVYLEKPGIETNDDGDD